MHLLLEIATIFFSSALAYSLTLSSKGQPYSVKNAIQLKDIIITNKSELFHMLPPKTSFQVAGSNQFNKRWWKLGFIAHLSLNYTLWKKIINFIFSLYSL